VIDQSYENIMRNDRKWEKKVQKQRESWWCEIIFRIKNSRDQQRNFLIILKYSSRMWNNRVWI
jgi:hypothetical protein